MTREASQGLQRPASRVARSVEVLRPSEWSVGSQLRRLALLLTFTTAATASCVAADVTSLAALDAAGQRYDPEQIAAVGRRGFLYEVTRPSGASSDVDPLGRKLFLYGTIHLGRVGSEPFNASVLQALRQSTRLALEADPTDGARVRALTLVLGRYDDGDGLQRHVSPALMARVRAFGARNGLPADQIGRLKPWLLANMVLLAEFDGTGLDPMLGVELYLSGFARGMRMPIVEIEGVEAQLRLLAGQPEAMQSAQLDEALNELDRDAAPAQTSALFDLWLNGDGPAGDELVARMHRDAQGKAYEQYFIDELIDRRNRTMADRAEHDLERPGNTFFAIGALHLFGEAGLIREFERRGYRVVDLQPRLAERR